MWFNGLLFLGFFSTINGLQIIDSLLPYWNKLPVRDPSTIDLIVIHFTEECDLAHAQATMSIVRYDDGTGNSGHYLIDRNGTVYRDVPYNHTAWNVIGFNEKSIGIETVNIGRYPDWFDSRSQIPLEPYGTGLIMNLVALVNQLKTELPNIKYIAGHDELDVTYDVSSDDPNCTLVRRKTDPGPQFPWNFVLNLVNLQHYQPYGQPGYTPIKICSNSSEDLRPEKNQLVTDAVTIIDDFLPYVNSLPMRNTSQIDLVVIHYTEGCDLASARTAMETVQYTDGTGNSGHYTVDRNGTIYRYVPYDHEAWHVIGYNSRSIGIENVNIGGYPKADNSQMQNPHEPFLDPIVDSIIALVNELKTELPSIKYISGHNDLDITWQPSTDDPNCIFVRRKLDPGPMFPWDRVLQAVGLEHYQPNGVVSLGPYNNCTVTPQPCTCPNGWLPTGIIGNQCKCYNFAAGASNWTVASDNCATWGSSIPANVASIDDAFENNDILQLGEKRTWDCDQLYIGLTRQNGVWTWSSGDPNGYRNWANVATYRNPVYTKKIYLGYPINDANANCAVFNQKMGTWSNVRCDQERCYLCKIENR